MKVPLKLKRPNSKKSVIFTEFWKNGEYYRFYSGKSIYTKNWSEKQVVKSAEENHDLINQYLEKWTDEIKRIFEEKELRQERITQEIIQGELDQFFNKNQRVEEGKAEDQEEINVIDFTSFMKSFVKLKKDDGKFLQKLQQAQKTVLIAFKLIEPKKLREYNKLGNKAKSQIELEADFKLPFKEINLQFLQKFKTFLNKSTYTVKENKKFVEKHYTTNYIDKQINGLKQFVNAAIEGKYVEHFTWDSVKSNGIEVDTIHTDFDKIQILSDFFLSKPNEKKIRDSYVINCFLGFRYSDFSRLQPHDFKKTVVKGEKILIYSGRNKKTGELIEFPIHPIAAAKLEEYNFQIPKYSAKEFNEVIKIVAKKAGFTQLITISETRAGKTTFMDVPMYELISSHTGRRSFCTNFYVEGIAIAIIMSISGHKTEKEFMRYIKKRAVRLEVAAEQISAIKGIKLRKVA